MIYYFMENNVVKVVIMQSKMYDLTNPQKSIWYTEEFLKGTSAENITGTVIVPNKVDFTLLEKAINIFVQKSDSFRLRFIAQSANVQQYFEEYKPFSVELISVSSEKDLKALENSVASTVFDVQNSLLFTFIMVKFPDDHGGFIVNMHHLISDAWSAGLGGSEIIRIYSMLLKNENIDNISYPSFAEHIDSEIEYMNSDKYIKDRTFWQDTFKTIPEIATIPSTNPPHGESVKFKANRKQFTMPKELIEEISNFCRNNQCSIFNFFMAVYSSYIGKVSNLDDFAIGTPILNRLNVKDKHTSGMFVSTVPLRILLIENMKFRDLAKNIGTNLFSIFKHQKYPYLSILEDLRHVDNTIPNLYNILISYQNIRSTAKNSSVPFEISWVPAEFTADNIDIHIYDMNDTRKYKYCL